MNGNVFKRRELKFMLTEQQYRTVIGVVGARLNSDRFGKSVVQSLYFDTPDYRLISRSLEKPNYKEKIRARCYNLNANDGKVFLELKKKYDGVVFKRRVCVKESVVFSFFTEKSALPDGQIEREITYFRDFYRSLRPSMLIIYDRTAYADENIDLRITFDENVRYRVTDLNLFASLCGEKITDKILMEIKSGSAMPLWLSKLLSENEIYKTSFSKYGAAYASFLSKGRRSTLRYKEIAPSSHELLARLSA